MTNNSIALNRTLFLADNLPVMRGLDSESIDLVATDPPFNKGVPAFSGTTKAGVDHEFKDVWHWGDVQDDWIDEIRGEHPRLYNVIRFTNDSAGSDMGAFLCWMAVRVLEMHRVLKDTGSMYLHCDPTASHYLKAMMDAVFGRGHFRNDIVWRRSGGKSDANKWGSSSDRILFYVKSDVYTWNRPYQPYDSEYIRKTFRHDDGDGRGKYQVNILHASGVRNGESGKPWRGIDITAKKRHWATPTKGASYKYILNNGIIPGYPDAYPSVLDRLDALDKAGMVYWPKNGGIPGLKIYLSGARGVASNDVVVDIAMASGDELTGWKTQKPLALYSRIIKASSNEGDMVLDPFAGCATTCVAAEQLGRKWIGIDIDAEAGNVVRDRLQNEVSASMAWGNVVQTPTVPPTRTDNGAPAAPELIITSPKPKQPKLSTKEVKAKLLDMDGMVCQGCGWVPPYADYLQVDHKQPRSKKGREVITNFGLLCEPCNRAKGNKYTFRELQERRIEEGRMNMEWYEKEGKWK